MKKLLNKKNIKYYLIYFFIIELVSQFNFIRGVISFLQIFIESAFNCTNFENFIRLFITSILFLVLFFSSLIILTLPITIFLLARKTADATLKRENSKYTSRENIIYYREKISGVSPTTISLIQNLEIEEDKDLTAIIMKMQLNNNIAIEGDTIKVSPYHQLFNKICFIILNIFVLVIFMMIVMKVPVSLTILWIPLIFLDFFLITFGICAFLLHYGVYVEDLANVIKIFLRLMSDRRLSMR